MATTNTCKKCGCQDSFMPSPAPCPTPQGCPNPEPCSEVLDSQCVIYSGSNILCNADVVVNTNDSVAEALEKIIDYFCVNAPSPIPITLTSAGGTVSLVNDGTGPTLAVKGLTAGYGINITTTSTAVTVAAACPIQVQITAGGGARSIQATVTGGLAPYTYSWVMADLIGGVGVSMWTLASTLNPAVVLPQLNPAVVDKFDSCGSANTGSVGLAKVIVTDANGCIAKDTFLLIDIACA
jgi:hypothetical protein